MITLYKNILKTVHLMQSGMEMFDSLNKHTQAHDQEFIAYDHDFHQHEAGGGLTAGSNLHNLSPLSPLKHHNDILVSLVCSNELTITTIIQV